MPYLALAVYRRLLYYIAQEEIIGYMTFFKGDAFMRFPKSKGRSPDKYRSNGLKSVENMTIY